MIIVRALTMIAKPAILGGAIATTAVGGWFAFDTLRPNDAPSAFQQVQSEGQRLLVSEFGETADTIVAIDPGDVTDRTTIATIEHASGYGIFATLSPDGQAIAYTALPSDTARPGPDTPALAAIVDVDGGVTPLADDVDLLVAPVWSPDSQSIVVRKNTPAEDSAGSFELLLLGRDGSRATLTTWTTASVFPIAYAPDASKIYFATLNTAGTDVYSIAPDGTAETKIAHLSDQIARDWRLSPDGATLAYSAAESGSTPSVIAKTLDLATGVAADAVAPDDLQAGPPSTGIARGELNPAWKAERRADDRLAEPRWRRQRAVRRRGGRRGDRDHELRKHRPAARLVARRDDARRPRRRRRDAVRSEREPRRTGARRRSAIAYRKAPTCRLWGGCGEGDLVVGCCDVGGWRRRWRWCRAAVAPTLVRPARDVDACAFTSAPLTYETTEDRKLYMQAMDLAGFDMLFPNDPFFSQTVDRDRHARIAHELTRRLHPADAAQGDQLDREHGDAGRARSAVRCRSARRSCRSTAATASRR